MLSESEIQRRYYAETAGRYDNMHMETDREHVFALAFLTSMLDYLGAESLLDIGAGTGRVGLHFAGKRPGLRVVGIEPVAELRTIGHAKGLSADELIDGDARSLKFPDGAFDVVCEFAVLHHVRSPAQVISEMLRVAKKAIFISDSNNFGQGRPLVRLIKQAINGARLWPVANFLKTRGRGFTVTEGDGLAYSYSVFNNFSLLRRQCHTVHVVNTSGVVRNSYCEAPHVAVLGIKAS